MEDMNYVHQICNDLLGMWQKAAERFGNGKSSLADYVDAVVTVLDGNPTIGSGIDCHYSDEMAALFKNCDVTLPFMAAAYRFARSGQTDDEFFEKMDRVTNALACEYATTAWGLTQAEISDAFEAESLPEEFAALGDYRKQIITLRASNLKSLEAQAG